VIWDCVNSCRISQNHRERGRCNQELALPDRSGSVIEGECFMRVMRRLALVALCLAAGELRGEDDAAAWCKR
jgi:hypothetical protein